MNSLLRPLVLGKPAPEQFSGLPTHCKDPLGFTWWLVTHLAMLGQYSRSGMVQDEVRIKILIVEDVLKCPAHEQKCVFVHYLNKNVFLSYDTVLHLILHKNPFTEMFNKKTICFGFLKMIVMNTECCVVLFKFV